MLSGPIASVLFKASQRYTRVISYVSIEVHLSSLDSGYSHK